MKSIKEADISSKTRVLLRADLDVPLKNGRITDTFRLDALHPTLAYLKEKNAKIIICGKIGRPEGKVVEELSTKHLRPYFDEILGKDTYELLENLRFDPRERENDEEFAKELVEKADIYVNDSFAVSHREDASIVGVPKLLPSYAGLRLLEEVKNLTKATKDPEKPLVAVIGGAKIETKKVAVLRFLEISDKVLVGGKIGLDWSGSTPGNLVLPKDYGSAEKDIGSETIKIYKEELAKAKTIIWNGPMGKFEEPDSEQGTKEISEAIANSTAFRVVGGGDTIAALNKFDLVEKMGFVSTGGGAMLQFIVDGNLTGLKAIGYDG